MQELTATPEDLAPLTAATTLRTLPFDTYLTQLATAPLFLPGRSQPGPDGAAATVIPTALDPDGTAWYVVGTSPAELFAWDPRVGARQTTLAEVADLALAHGTAGLVVNPVGPSVTVPADLLRSTTPAP